MAHACTLHRVESETDPLQEADVSANKNLSLRSSPHQLALLLLGGTLLAAAGGFWAGAPRVNRHRRSALGNIAPSRGLALGSLGCHTAVPGDKCFEKVQFAIRQHHDEHPDWYHGLSKQSSLEEFQNYLHEEQPDAGCPVPCNLEAAKKSTQVKLGFYATCHTAKEAEPCYSRIEYTLRHISSKPEQYKGLTKDSTFAEVQRYLYKNANEGEKVCPKPCAGTTGDDEPSAAGSSPEGAAIDDETVSVRSFTIEDDSDTDNATIADPAHVVVA